MVSKPHGGKILESFGEFEDHPSIQISHETTIDLINLGVGAYSPLKGFMTREEFESVIETGRLTNDLPWTIPIVLDSNEKLTGEYNLVHNGKAIGKIEVEDVFVPDKKKWAKSVFGTTSKEHPGVKKTFETKKYLIGGKITLYDISVDFRDHYLTPKEARVLFKSKKWDTIVGFQTRNVPHLGHEFVQKTALTFVDGIFINPVVGYKKPGDFKDDLIIKAYETLIKHYYLKDTAVLAVLPWGMKYAGPKEAIMHAIIRKNYGCTHIVIGRDHAGVGDFYDKYAAQRIFEEYPDIGIIPLFFREFFYCKKCGSIVNEKICPHEDSRVRFSGTKIRKLLTEGKRPTGLMRDEVIDLILSYKDPFVS